MDYIPSDQEIKDLDKETIYFNLELSPEKTLLVFNASKKGIDAYLQKYGELEVPPAVISFQSLQRPQRRWYQSIRKSYSNNCYYAHPNWNSLVPLLRIEFLKEDDNSTVVFCAGLRGDKPFLFLNAKGWKKFLEMLKYLRDDSYMFEVKIADLTNDSESFSNFQLTLPYKGDRWDQPFKTIEFIRLEPEENTVVLTSLYFEYHSGSLSNTQMIWGNCTGFLLFSKWLRSFAEGDELSRNIINRFNEIPSVFRCIECEIAGNDLSSTWPYSDLEGITTYPTRLYLKKIEADNPYPIFLFEKMDNRSRNLSIYGNNKGFEELSQIFEEYAFSSDECRFESSSPNQRRRGESALGFIEGKQSPYYWKIRGGKSFSVKYGRSKAVIWNNCPHVDNIHTFNNFETYLKTKNTK